MFLGKDILKICYKFTGEQPCGSLISIKLQSNFIETNVDVFLYICCIFSGQIFLRTPLEGCFWVFLHLHPEKCSIKDSRMQILYLLFDKIYFWFDVIWFWICYWVFTRGSVWLYKRLHKMQLEQCLNELTLCIRGCSYEVSWPG